MRTDTLGYLPKGLPTSWKSHRRKPRPYTHHGPPWICPSIHRQARTVQQNTGGHVLTPKSCSQGLTGCAPLAVPSDDLVPEARLHLSGWTSRKSALAPQGQLDSSITSSIQKPKRSPGGVTGNRNRGRKCVWWGSHYFPSALPSPTPKPGHLLLQSNVLPGVPGTPVHPPRSPLEKDALLGKAPVAKSSSGIDIPCPACGETTQFTATASTQRLLTPF